MDHARSTQFIVAHPIAAYFGWVAAFALMFLLAAVILGWRQSWPLFVVFGVLLPVAVVTKARR